MVTKLFLSATHTLTPAVTAYKFFNEYVTKKRLKSFEMLEAKGLR